MFNLSYLPSTILFYLSITLLPVLIIQTPPPSRLQLPAYQLLRIFYLGGLFLRVNSFEVHLLLEDLFGVEFIEGGLLDEGRF
jgi:hypothetical protein